MTCSRISPDDQAYLYRCWGYLTRSTRTPCLKYFCLQPKAKDCKHLVLRAWYHSRLLSDQVLAVLEVTKNLLCALHTKSVRTRTCLDIFGIYIEHTGRRRLNHRLTCLLYNSRLEARIYQFVWLWTSRGRHLSKHCAFVVLTIWLMALHQSHLHSLASNWFGTEKFTLTKSSRVS